jgi:hypothetical protein
MTARFTTYADFWPYYLREHARPATRALHYVGSVFAIIIFVWMVITRQPVLLLAVAATGYGFAWTAHAFVEHNKPATFTYPLWSLVSDFRMLGLWISGRLKPHLDHAGEGPN